MFAEREALPQLFDQCRVYMLGLWDFLCAKNLNEGSCQYLFGFQLIACHVKGQCENAMAMAVVHIPLYVRLLPSRLAGSYNPDWAPMNDRFEFEQVRLYTQCIPIDYFGSWVAAVEISYFAESQRRYTFRSTSS